MSDLFASKEHQEYAENVITQYLRDAGYSGSLEAGTGLYDAVIRPSALIYTMMLQDVTKAQAYMSLARAEEVRDQLSDDEYDAAVDGVLSNWFVTRNMGTSAEGSVRLFFSKAPEFLSYADGESVASASNVGFVADGLQAFAQSDFKALVNSTNNTIEYYVDVLVKSASPSAVSVPYGTVMTAVVPDIYFLRATATYDFTDGEEVESSDRFIERTKEAITTRELITRRAINTVIGQDFPEVSRVYTAGHGARELMRDMVMFQNVMVHVGNMADIWIASYLSKFEEKVTAKFASRSEPRSITTERTVVDGEGRITVEVVKEYSGEKVSTTTDGGIEEDESLFGTEKTVKTTVTPVTYVCVPSVLPAHILGCSVERYLVDGDGREIADTRAVYENPEIAIDVSETRWLSCDENDEYAPKSMDGIYITIDRITVTETGSGLDVDDDADESGSGADSGGDDADKELEDLIDTYSAEMSDTYDTNADTSDRDWSEDSLSGDWTSTVVETSEATEAIDVTITGITSQAVHAVSNRLRSEDDRVMSYDPLAKMMVPVIMWYDLTVHASTSDDEEKERVEHDVKSAVLAYLIELRYSGGMWVESEMIKRIHASVPEVYAVDIPTSCKAELFDMHSRRLVSVQCRNRFELPSGISKQISANTVQYYSNDDLITVTVAE